MAVMVAAVEDHPITVAAGKTEEEKVAPASVSAEPGEIQGNYKNI